MTLSSIGRYEIRKELGRGGMATVFQGFDPRFKREVAIKLLPREFLHDPNFRARFDREATTIASLEHSAIVPVYDFGEEDGQPYLVMRFMPGGSLADKLGRGRQSLEETAKILNRISGALDFAHENGVIHRDLKPANILFDKRGDAYLADFGIVKLTEEAATLTGAGGIIGTPAYMSPEQAQGKGRIDNRSDLYSLGVILFQMLTGSQPFEADTPIGLAVMHINEPTPDILKAQPDLPAGIGTFIQKAMAKAKGDRFGTAKELAGAYETSTKEEVVEAPSEPELDPTLISTEAEVVEEVVVPPQPIPNKAVPAVKESRPSRFNLLPILGAGGVIVVIGGIALFVLRGGADLFAPAPEPTPSPTATRTAVPTVTQTTTPKPTSTITSTPTTAFDPRAMVEIARPLDGQYDVHAVAWSPDGSKLAALEGVYEVVGQWETGILYVWDSSDFGTYLAKKAVNNTFPEMAAWSSDGSLLATSGRGGVVQLWDTQTWEISKEIDITAETGRSIGATSGVLWSPVVTNRLATGSNDGRINIWNIDTGESQVQICCPNFGRGYRYHLAWSDDGSTIAGLTGTGRTSIVTLWDSETGNLLKEYPGWHRIDFSPTKPQLLGIGWEELYFSKFLYVWDTVSGTQVHRLKLDIYSLMATWSPDGELIAIALQHAIEIRDSETGELRHTIEEYDPSVELSYIQFIDWSPDGTMLAAASLDGTVRVFGIPDG
jgi:serine/threonine-protein kinase